MAKNRLAPTVCLCIALTACAHHERTLAGNWTHEETVLGRQLTIVTTWGPGNAYQSTSTFPMSNNASIRTVDKGTFQLTGDKVTVHLDDVDWIPVTNNPKVAKIVKDHIAAGKKKMIEQANNQPQSVLKWIDDNSFTLEDGNKTITYHRAN